MPWSGHRSAAATGNVSPSGEVCTRTHAGTTNPKWEESFLLVVQDAAHSLRIVAAHDSQKGEVWFCIMSWAIMECPLRSGLHACLEPGPHT